MTVYQSLDISIVIKPKTKNEENPTRTQLISPSLRRASSHSMNVLSMVPSIHPIVAPLRTNYRISPLAISALAISLLCAKIQRHCALITALHLLVVFLPPSVCPFLDPTPALDRPRALNHTIIYRMPSCPCGCWCTLTGSAPRPSNGSRPVWPLFHSRRRMDVLLLFTAFGRSDVLDSLPPSPTSTHTHLDSPILTRRTCPIYYSNANGKESRTYDPSSFH